MRGALTPLNAVPWAAIDAVFLDAGNTLVSMDFDWILRELRGRGGDADRATLLRAEAAARPHVSARLAELGSTEGWTPFTSYLGLILAGLEERGFPMPRPVPELSADLGAALGGRDRTQELWSAVLDGVPSALARMRASGLKLIVVSNSDGTIEQGLSAVGLGAAIDGVVDSHAVGHEKPDPRIFEHALRLSGSAPERTLHVGDLYAADVVGARAAGVHVVLLDPYGDWGDVDCARARDLAAVADALVGARSS